MKSILNKAAHDLMKLAHKPVSCSDSDQELYIQQAEALQLEISEWIGSEERECVGLGQNCNSSWYLKATGNKSASYPFDWLFTTPEIVLDMLGNDFEAFLDRSQYIPHGLDAGHERYHETLFGHRNPASSKSDHEFFNRSVARWHSLMEAKKSVVFVTVILNESDKRKRWKEGFTKQFQMPRDQKLSDYQPVIEKIRLVNPNCKFLFIEQYTEEPFALSVIEKTQQTFWLKFFAIDKNTGVQYLHEVDDAVMKTIINGLKS